MYNTYNESFEKYNVEDGNFELYTKADDSIIDKKVFAVVLFAVLMFLLTKLIVEKNTTSISMVKILGYSNREISRLYVTSTTLVVVISVVVSMGLSVIIMNYLFRVFMEKMSGWITCYYKPSIFPVMFMMNILVYAVISLFMMAKIKKIPMDEALKNVE